VLGGLALAASAGPVLAGAVDGWWRMPHGDFRGVLAFVDEDVHDVPSRILWLGEPDVMPGGGWTWRDGISYATSLEGGPDVRDLWPGADEGANRRLARALDVAADRRTTRLGRLLAPMGVQYIAVPQRLAPSPFAEERHALPRSVLTALGAQLDLEEVQLDPAIRLYRNTAFAPARALVANPFAVGASDVEAMQRIDLSGSFPVLPDHDGVGYRGTLPPGFTMVYAAASGSVSGSGSGRWHLTVGGEEVERSTAYGWASAFSTGPGGEAVLSYDASVWYRVLVGVQLLAWAFVLVAVLRMRFAGSTSPAPPVLPPGGGDDDGVRPSARGRVVVTPPPGQAPTLELEPVNGRRPPPAVPGRRELVPVSRGSRVSRTAVHRAGPSGVEW
jgi:hypothetical protein